MGEKIRLALAPLLLIVALVLPATVAQADEIKGANIVLKSSNLNLETETSNSACTTSTLTFTTIAKSAYLTGGSFLGPEEEKYCEDLENPGVYFTVSVNSPETAWFMLAIKEGQGTLLGVPSPLLLNYTYYIEMGGGLFELARCAYEAKSVPIEYAYGENPLMKIGQNATWVLAEAVGEGCGANGLLTGDFETEGLTINE